MSFIEDLFGPEAKKELKEAHLQSLIEREVPEGLSLDYKGADSLSKPVELSKYPSGFANSNGGILIVGLATTKKTKNGPDVPTRIAGTKTTAHSMQWFQNVVLDPIRPALGGVDVRMVETEKGNVFVVEVAQSETPPHMAADRRYYFRTGDRTLPMEHYMITDYMGRRRRAVLRPELHITSRDETGTILGFELQVYNDGRGLAKWPMTYVVMTGVEEDKEKDDGGAWSHRRFQQTGKAPRRLVVSAQSPIEVIHPGFYHTNTETRATMAGPALMVNVTLSAEDIDTTQYLGIIDRRWLDDWWSRRRTNRSLEVQLLNLSRPLDGVEQFAGWLHESLDQVLEDKEDPVCRLFVATLKDALDDLPARLSQASAEVKRGMEEMRAYFQKIQDGTLPAPDLDSSPP